jgi:hypothetical protein
VLEPDELGPLQLQHLKCDKHERYVRRVLKTDELEPLQLQHLECDKHEQYVLWVQ